VAGNLAAAINIIMEDGIVEVFSGLVVYDNDRETMIKKLAAVLHAERGGTHNHPVSTVL